MRLALISLRPHVDTLTGGVIAMVGQPSNGGHIRVLIADDQAPFARLLETLLADDDEVEVVGHARNGAEALELADSADPDLILMDISMPVMDGLEATRRLRESGSHARIVMLTESDLRADTVRAQRAGAHAFVAKTRIASGLRDAIHSVPPS
jgi:DNA-binding NarL/FixJ family response regulator